MVRFSGCVLLILFAANSVFAASDCDRTCLRNVLDQYLNAVIKHDPSAAPLFVGFRQTENAVVVKPGNGVWKTVTALGKVQRRYFDAVTGQAGYFGLLDENGAPAIATLRLKVDDRKVMEAEWVISRKTDVGLNGGANGQFDPDTLIANPPPERTLPKDARMSREAMLAATNSYFDGISTHDGSIIMAIPGCSRFENGIAVTGRGGRGGAAPAPAPTGARGTPSAAPSVGPAAVSDCTSGLATINILFVAARRYPLIDEEAGVVLGMVIFQRNPGTTSRRNLLSEWFHLENNKIKTIYAAMFYPPPEAPAPNWPPFEPNWPIQLPSAAAPAGQR
jgi:hypothetical protein